MRLLLLLLAPALCSPVVAAERHEADLLLDCVKAYDEATVENSLASEARSTTVSGGVPMSAVALHPLDQGRAVVSYRELRAPVDSAKRGFLLTQAGIADGVNWQDTQANPDGVGFTVTVNGEDAASTYLTSSRWRPMVAPLFVSEGGVRQEIGVSFALCTDSGPNHTASYDWGQFGDPIAVAVDAAPIAEGQACYGPSGVAIAQVAGGAGRFIIEGLDAADVPIEGATASVEVEEGAQWTYLRFDFAEHTECAAWRWRSEGAQVESVWGGAFGSQLSFKWAGPAQGVTCEGEPLRWRVTVRNDGLGAHLDDDPGEVDCDGRRLPVGRVAPGDERTIEFDLGPRQAGELRVDAGLTTPPQWSGFSTGHMIWPRLPDLPETPPGRASFRRLDDTFAVAGNGRVRLLFGRDGALLYCRRADEWVLVGTIRPWLEVPLQGQGSRTVDLAVADETEEPGDGVLLTLSGGDADFAGAGTIGIPDEGRFIAIHLSLEAKHPIEVDGLWGSAVHVGDRATGAHKGVAIFPGLEYLEGDEQSSSTRDIAPPASDRWVPHKLKITVPMMLVETEPDGPVVALAWDPRQEWRTGNREPAAAFASPDRLTYQDSHLMQLLLPTVPDLMPESSRRASAPLTMEPGKPWSFTQALFVGVPEPDAEAAFSWYDEVFGFPQAEAWPRSFEEEMALSRHGFLVTTWDPETQTSSHTAGAPGADAPGYAALMLMDARAVAEGDARQAVQDRADLIGRKTLDVPGPSGLASTTGCHIMRWELPYHWGHIDGALQGMKAQAYAAINTQEDDGGWGFHVGPGRASLGPDGARVLGIPAFNAYIIAKWLAISGDPVAERSLRRALDHLKQYRVPRGAQGWECPIYEPDILATANAVRAYTWAYAALGEEPLLERARRWARTGLPFQYAWDDGVHPGMRYASIPVFGSTFYHHSWLGLPVQWCGLVYAYSLQELMRYGEDNLLRRQVEGITVSAMHQQWPFGENDELTGTYPDSFGQSFTVRNPVHINPEDIVVNTLAMKGLDPGIRSRRVAMGDKTVHLASVADIAAEATADGLRATVHYVRNQTLYATLAPVQVGDGTAVTADGRPLERRDSLPEGVTGWAYDEALGALCIGLSADGDGRAELIVSGVEARR